MGVHTVPESRNCAATSDKLGITLKYLPRREHACHHYNSSMERLQIPSNAWSSPALMYFKTIFAISSSYCMYLVRFSFRIAFFYLATVSWIFYISLLRENSINPNQSYADPHEIPSSVKRLFGFPSGSLRPRKSTKEFSLRKHCTPYFLLADLFSWRKKIKRFVVIISSFAKFERFGRNT